MLNQQAKGAKAPVAYCSEESPVYIYIYNLVSFCECIDVVPSVIIICKYYTTMLYFLDYDF